MPTAYRPILLALPPTISTGAPGVRSRCGATVRYASHRLSLALAAASASDNLCDAYRTVAPHLERTPGAPVLIVGGSAKSIGLYAVGIAKALGASHIDYLDTSRTRLTLAERLGANPIAITRSESWYAR